MKKINVIIIAIISCSFVLFFNYYKVKADGDSIETINDITPTDSQSTPDETIFRGSYATGSRVGFTGGDTSDYTSETITDTTDVVYDSDVMSDDEKKYAWYNWYASLFDETDAVLDSGYTNGKITRVLKSRMNIIPYQELTGFEWVEAENNDIGAVRFEDGGEWELRPTMEINGWRI